MKSFKKILTALLACISLCAGAAGLTACDFNFGGETNDSESSNEVVEIGPVEEPESSYGDEEVFIYGEWYVYKEATCTAGGEERRDCINVEGYFQGRYTSALGHDYTAETTVSATCTTQGYTVYVCSRCGDTYVSDYKNPLGHDYGIEEYVEASCTEDGYVLFACSRCDSTKKQVLEKTGHEFGNDNVCDNCGYTVSVHTHTYTVTTVAPTCMGMGYTEYACSCGYSYKTDYVEQLGHKYDDGTVTKEKTCTENGVITYTCTRCGADYEEIVFAGHTWSETIVKEATCKEDGEKSKVCLGCGAKESERIPAAHDWSKQSTIKEATCTENGEAYYICNVCGETTTEEIPALGHYYVNGICQRCGRGYMDDVKEDVEHPVYGMYFEIDTIVSAYGPIAIDEYGVYLYYNEDAVIEKVAVYLIQEGTMWRRCIACTGTNIQYAMYVPYLSSEGDMLYTGLNSNMINVFPLKKNSDGIWCYSNYATIGVNLADKNGNLLLSLYDIGQAGAKTRIFADLDEMISWLKSFCITHVESDWTVVSEPTCTSTGTACKICTACGMVLETYTLAKLGHNFTKVEAVAPTCVDAGNIEYYACATCGKNFADPNGETVLETVVVDALGHNEAVPATCTKPAHCDVCDKDYGEALGHNYVNGVCTRCGGTTVVIGSQGLLYELSSDKTYYIVRGIGTCTDTDLVIPSTHEGLPVKEIYSAENYSDGAFWGQTRLNSVVIPDSVTSIGDRAFRNCSSLTSVTIGNSVTSIGDWAFSCCRSLTSVTIGNGVTTIGDGAFAYCRSLTSITIPDSVTSIGSYAFDGCSSLTSVTIGNNVTSIGDRAFYSCSSLTSVTIGNNVTSIGDWAFAYCSSLTSIKIPDSVTYIGESAFYGCSSLTSITFEDTSTWYRTEYYTEWENKTGGTSTTVTSPSANATYFKSTYYYYHWYKL